MLYSEIIKTIREENDLSQTALAKILDVSQKVISNWEKGKDKPSYDSMVLLYEKFNITPNEIMNISGEPTIQNVKEKELIENFKHLSTQNQIKLLVYASGLLDGQNAE